MFIVESKARKLVCPFLGGRCRGRKCMAWESVKEEGGRHPAFEMTRCFGYVEDPEGCQPGRCSECLHCPGRCVLMHPTAPYKRGLKTVG